MTCAVGVWRSLVSRLVRDQEAMGSNPVTPTIKNAVTDRVSAVTAFSFSLKNKKVQQKSATIYWEIYTTNIFRDRFNFSAHYKVNRTPSLKNLFT